MDKYRVISLSLTGKAPRKIFRKGEIITQDNVIPPVGDLVKNGFLEKAEDDAVTPEGIETYACPFTPPKKEKKGVEVNAEVAPEDDETGDQETEEEKLAREAAEKSKLENADDLKDDDLDEDEDEEDLTRNDMMASLDELGVKYNKNASKAQLLDLYKEAMANKDAQE